jgi:hypothetical protein
VLLREEVRVLLGGGVGEHSGGPEVGGEEGVGLAEGVVHGHRQVTSGTGVTARGRVHILDTSHGEELLGDEGGDNAGTTGGGDQAHAHGAGLAGDLAGHGVGGTGVEAPVASAHGDQVLLRVDDAASDGSGDFLRGLDTKTNVAVAITDSDVALEAGALTGSGLLLDGHDLHDLVSEGGAQEVINNLVLLDGEGEKEDLLDGLDLALLHKAAKLGAGDPLLLVTALLSSATASAAIATTSAITTSASATTETTTTIFVSHFI